MTTLFITRKFPPSKGGMENFAFELYTSLSQTLEVTLIKWGGSNKYLPFVLPLFLVRACWVLATQPIDMIHIQDGLLAPLGALLAAIFRKPFVVVVHGLDLTYPSRLYQTINVPLVRRANRVICISEAAAIEARKRGVQQSHIEVVPIGIFDNLYRKDRAVARRELREWLGLRPDTPILLTVGRLVRRKGVAWFIANVLPKLAKKYPSLVYVVIGAGEDREYIEHQVRDFQLDDRVRLLGRVDGGVISQLYNGADVFVQPNIKVAGDMEGFGLVLLEASLCELPVVATGIEGITDAISDGKNGVLVPHEKDASTFMAATERFLVEPTFTRNFGRTSRRYTLSHYQWPEIARRYKAVYSAILLEPIR